ncbi:hypothetical protein BDZ97DRAFT_1922493 [Flammula alnicola]|nr:hypothetical protein BDZ97DRAFT_1922493 [Flammula alnicola]
MKRATAVGDLQKGECYVNMDYFFLSSIRDNIPQRIVVAYDIACQWGRNLRSRCDVYPPNALSSHNITFLVPKFHLPAHISQCQIDYLFNLVPGVGRMDGEAAERGWSAANAVATSTKEMGPGLHRDTLDDHFGDYNWRKIAQFDAEVRLQLAQENAQALADGARTAIHEDVSLSMLIYRGLKHEDLQRHLALDVAELGPHSTSLQRAKILERSNSLCHRIDAWVDIQHLYIPGLAVLHAQEDRQGGGTPPAVQDLELFLPSHIVGTVACDERFLRYEFDLRISQADTTLDEIRSSLLLRSHMYKSKDRLVRGQCQNTRSNVLLGRVEDRVKVASDRYNKIRHALTALSAPLLEFDWSQKFRVLELADVTGLTSLDDDGSEGRKKLLWIWMVHGTGANVGDTDRTNAALCIEWCKARARAHRWQEECLLLQEEMHRVIAYFSWQAKKWRRQAEGHADKVLTSSRTDARLVAADTAAESIVREGKVTYAYQQAAI